MPRAPLESLNRNLLTSATRARRPNKQNFDALHWTDEDVRAAVANATPSAPLSLTDFFLPTQVIAGIGPEWHQSSNIPCRDPHSFTRFDFDNAKLVLSDLGGQGGRCTDYSDASTGGGTDCDGNIIAPYAGTLATELCLYEQPSPVSRRTVR